MIGLGKNVLSGLVLMTIGVMMTVISAILNVSQDANQRKNTMISRNFILAGKAVFTISNGKGDHYTYKVAAKRQEGFPVVYFAWVRYAGRYQYLGMVEEKIDRLHCYPTRRSVFSYTDKETKVINFAFRMVCGVQTVPEGYDVIHEGKCGRCGLKLNTPLSIKTGFGPVCMKKLGIYS